MLKVRVIPTLLWKNFGLVKGVSFNSWRRVGPVLPAIKVFNSRDVDELVLVDITASLQNNTPDYNSIIDFSDECSIPFTVGGGIKTKDHIIKLLHSGADKITINSSAYINPDLINISANTFGSQCVISSIDVKKMPDGSYSCFAFSGTKNMNINPVDWALELQDRGAGEILLTSIDRDGTMTGYELEIIERITKKLSIPLIASGGAGNYDHMIEVIKNAGASAVAAASIFHFTEQTPTEAKRALQNAGIQTRRNFLKEFI